MDNYSLSDIAAITRGNDRDNDVLFGGGGMLTLIIVFILLFGLFGGGNLFGNRNVGAMDYATQASVQRGFDTQEILNKLNGISNGICDSTYALNNTLQSGFAGVNMNMVQGVNTVQQSLCQGFNGVNQNINDLGYRLQQCCCDLQRTSDANTRAILDRLCQNEITDLRDRLALANNAITAQTLANDIVSQVAPTPRPAWLTCSPYQAANYYSNFSGCGNGRSCGC